MSVSGKEGKFKMTIKTRTFGCSREAMDRIAEVFGMTNEQLARSGMDLDVMDTARWLVEHGIDGPDQVEASLGPRPARYPARFLEAVVIAANDLTIAP
jgi:hypothetical protein